MSDKVELIMPKMGESIAEATILKWLKKEGDEIKIDEPVLEIATDKVDSEVPSPVEGKLEKILFNENDVVEVGKAVALIATAGSASATESVPAAETESKTGEADKGLSPEKINVTEQKDQKPAAAQIDKSQASRFYSPLVLNIARSEGITMDELEDLEGTGKDGRVTKKDILAYVKDGGRKAAKPAQEEAPQQQQASSLSGASAAPSAPKKVDIPVFEGDEIIEMDRMRKLIAEHMVNSKHTSPHVTSMVEVDMTNVVRWRDKYKKEFEKREGQKLTFTPIFIEAIVKAIKDFPMINISLAGDKIIKRKSINIGMAAALPSGNLIVPVIHNADELNLTGLAKRVNDLAKRARDNKLKPEEIQGGTYTVTNVGTFGNVMGTPVINQPQVAIMAVGAIRKKPAVLETPDGDVIAIRQMMFLSHSYDHRIVDGALGGSFVKRVAEYLEQWDVNRSV